MIKYCLSRLLWMVRPPRKISFTKEGLIFTLFTLPIGLAAINTGNNMLYLILGMLLSIIATNGILSETVIKKVSLRSKLPSRAFAQDSFSAFVELINGKKRFPSYILRVSHIWQNASQKISIEEKAGTCIKLNPQSSTKVRIQSKIPHRGKYSIRGYKIATRFPFGLFDKSREILEPQEIVVYPKPLAVQVEGRGYSQNWGNADRNARGMGGDLFALREYRHGDDARHIHWKVSAKMRRPILQEFSATGREKGVVVFDNRILRGSSFNEKYFEQAVSKVAYLIDLAFREDREMGLWTPDRFFSANCGESHYHDMMCYLAIIQPREASALSDRQDQNLDEISSSLTVYRIPAQVPMQGKPDQVSAS